MFQEELYKICLLNSDNGQDGSHLFPDHPDIIGDRSVLYTSRTLYSQSVYRIKPPVLCPILYKHSPYDLMLIQDKSSGYVLGSLHNQTKHCCNMLILNIPMLSFE